MVKLGSPSLMASSCAKVTGPGEEPLDPGHGRKARQLRGDRHRHPEPPARPRAFDDATFAVAWEQGRGLTIDAAVALALDSTVVRRGRV
jgi:hypothetical protein